MLFDKNNLQLTLLSVSEVKQKNVKRNCANRSFGALSFRFHADTELVTKSSAHHVCDNYICYVPPHLDYERIAKVDDLIAINVRISGYTADDIEIFVPHKPEPFIRLFREALDCYNKKEIGYVHKCSSLFFAILSECCLQNEQIATVNSKIQNSVDMLNTRYTDPELSIGDAAAASYMSEVYFRKLFKEEFGLSPQKYVINLRLQRAIELINTREYSLLEVAFMSGYRDYKYFSTEFKRSFGTSPSNYRAKK